MGLMSFLERRLQSIKKDTSMPCVADRMDKPVQGKTAFAVDLYHALRKASSGNLFLSPFSVSVCLAMALIGARHNTASQIARCLRFGVDDGEAHLGFAKLQETLLADGRAANVELRIANRLWADTRLSVLSEFLDSIDHYYRGGFQKVDFSNGQKACGLINDWVNEATNGLIRQLLTESQVNGGLLVLANAIYFDGKWSVPFKKEATELRPFYLGVWTSIEVSMMIQCAAAGYAKPQGLQILEKWYGGGEFSMLVLLPDRYDGLQGLEESLSSQNLDRWLSLLKPVDKLYIELPKFRIECRPPLKGALIEMGMTDMFDPRMADFAPITGNKDLFVNEAIHKSVIEVEEKGTRAAAATALGFFTGAAANPEPTVIFRADHPFMFLIRHNPSGTILFVGRVVAP